MVAARPAFAIIRAIGCLFARRTIRPILIIAAIVLLVLHGAGTFAVFQNVWWWIFEAVLIILTLVFVVLLAVVLLVLRIVEPQQSPRQKQAVSRFVDKLQRVAETIGTPMPLVVLYVIKDTLFPRRGGFIETISEDSRTLAPDFARLHDEFNRPLT